jgi:hypothetical protein
MKLAAASFLISGHRLKRQTSIEDFAAYFTMGGLFSGNAAKLDRSQLQGLVGTPLGPVVLGGNRVTERHGISSPV